MPASLSNSVNAFDPDWQVAHTNSWSADSSDRREGHGDRSPLRRDAQPRWQHHPNLNEVVVVENGFADEYRLAQANLQANIAAGRGATFAFFGAGTSPLPIYLANFTGRNRSLARSGAVHRHELDQRRPGQPARAILPARRSALPRVAPEQRDVPIEHAARRPAGEFWVMNPDVSGASLTQSIAFTE